MSDSDKKASSPIFQFVIILISVFSIVLPLSLFMTKVGMLKALLYSGGLYSSIFVGLLIVSKFPSGIGTIVDVPIGAPIDWKPLVVATGIFTILFSGMVYPAL